MDKPQDIPLSSEKIIIFYYHQQPNYVLSNFYPHVPGKKLKSLNIIYKGSSFPTSEHLYHALKFKWETPQELEWLHHIRTAPTPGIAKHLGHFYTTKRWAWQQAATSLVEKYKDQVRLAGDLDDEKFRRGIMKIAIEARYNSCPDFAAALQETYPCKLVEDSDDPNWGRERNWLGNLLMEVRDARR